LNRIKDALLGVAIGDALGVPVEFRSRSDIQKNPVTDMRGYGTYNVPAGTWSDDSSLTFCLAEALTQNFDLNVIGENFVQWLRHNYWTARGVVFDVGITTRAAINNVAAGTPPEFAVDFTKMKMVMVH
jgi:ADP-ribosylglycohydrolase